MIGLSDDIVQRRIRPGVYRSASIAGRFLAASDAWTIYAKNERCFPASATGRLRGQHPNPDLSAVRGQDQAKRALEVAAAGGHNVLITGPPRAGNLVLL